MRLLCAIFIARCNLNNLLWFSMYDDVETKTKYLNIFESICECAHALIQLKLVMFHVTWIRSRTVRQRDGERISSGNFLIETKLWMMDGWIGVSNAQWVHIAFRSCVMFDGSTGQTFHTHIHNWKVPLNWRLRWLWASHEMYIAIIKVVAKLFKRGSSPNAAFEFFVDFARWVSSLSLNFYSTSHTESERAYKRMLWQR